MLAGLALWWAVVSGAGEIDLGLWNERSLPDFIVGVGAVVFAIAVGVMIGRNRAPGKPDPFVPRNARALIFDLLVRLTFLTALCEELLFRGVLLWVWMAALDTEVDSSVISSIPPIAAAGVAFGLWHIMPTVVRQRAMGSRASVLVIARDVGGTFIFAVVMGLLRLRTGSIVGPWLVHVGLNASAIMAKYVAQARAQRRPDED